jgi:hypothetical protein
LIFLPELINTSQWFFEVDLVKVLDQWKRPRLWQWSPTDGFLFFAIAVDEPETET